MEPVTNSAAEHREEPDEGSVATATIRDVARRAGVSVASASRVLNNHPSVTQTMRDRVLQAARVLDYVPHLGARSLSRGSWNTIGVVLPDLFGEFFSEIIRGIDFAAHKRGLQLLLSNMHGSADDTELAIRTMRGRVDGLLVMSPQLDPAFLARNLPKGLPAVVMNTAGSDGTHPTIAIDNHAGVRKAIAHLVDQGCRRIAHLTGPQGNADADARRAGFRAAVAEMLDPDTAIEIEGDFSEEAGIAAAHRILGLAPRVDGLFAANDMMAVACMATLARHDVRAPDDIAIVGFDGVPIAQYVTPALSTMALNLADLGERAVDRLVAAINDPHGDIAWLCAPRWDSPAVLSTLLGGRGRYSVAPVQRFVWGGYYEDGSLIWRSRWITDDDAVVECREALAFPGDPHRAVILRQLSAVRGEAHVAALLAPAADFGHASFSGVRRSGDGVWTGRSGALRVRWSGAPRAVFDGESGALRAQLRLSPGERHDLVLELSDREFDRPPPHPGSAWGATETGWRETLPDLGRTVADRDARHAYAVMRGLTTGAGGMVAAATTSLPERADQGRDYDYRYVYVNGQPALIDPGTRRVVYVVR